MRSGGGMEQYSISVTPMGGRLARCARAIQEMFELFVIADYWLQFEFWVNQFSLWEVSSFYKYFETL
jgi:hypothetical protein